MDPIESITLYKDTSFAMLLEAQHRGYQLEYMEMSDLFIEQGVAKASLRALEVREDSSDWFSLGQAREAPLASLDVILMRKDPPVDNQFIYVTHMLDLAEKAGTLVVNKPQSLRDFNEKLFAFWFPDLIPNTLVTRDAQQIRDFHQQQQDIICKPLDGMGGTSIFRVKADGNNLGVIIETLTENGSQYAMFQQFLPEITQGDKRILIVDGEVMPYCLARLPKQGENRGNLAAGGTGRPQAISASDRQIAERIAPVLQQHGLIFVGLDVIGDKVTEINVTSPTCVREIEAAYDINICAKLFNAIERKLSTKQ
jgi:glutathione synthase